LTASEVYPVGAASGAQAKSPSALQNDLREGKRGSIAKRWSRRTRRYVEGKIGSRGVRLVYPVGGKPGARVMIARSGPQGKQREQVSEGLKASYWPRRMSLTPPRDSYF